MTRLYSTLCLLLSVCSLSSSSAFASVGVDAAEKFLASDYIIVEGKNEYKLSINSKMEVKLTSHEEADGFVAGVEIQALSSDLMGSLPVVTMTIAHASDEDADALMIRLSFAQNSSNGQVYLQLVDAIKTFNDGPNETTSVDKAVVTVKRKAKSGKFVQLRKF